MAFNEVIKKKFGGAHAASNRVIISGTPEALRVTFSGDILEKLGNPLFVKVLVGSGADSGKMLVRGSAIKNTSAYKLTGAKNGKSKHFAISPNHLSPTLKKDVQRKAKAGTKKYMNAVAVPHTVSDAGLVIDFSPISS